MKSDWETVTTAELIDAGALVIGDGYRAKNDEMGLEGLPFVRAGNIDGGINLEDADILDRDSVEKAGEKIARLGDSLFTSKGTVGRFAYVRESTPPFVYSPQLCYWRVLDHTTLEPAFIYFWLQGSESWEQLRAFKGQTDMADYVSLADQRQMKITLPLIGEQRRIGAVLATLDDKIQANRRLGLHLNRLSQLVYQALASQARTGAGWTSEPIGDVVTVVGGSTPSTREPTYWDGHIRFATPKDLAALTFPVLTDTARGITEAGLAQISSGLLPPGTILLSSRAPIGYVAMTEVAVAVNQGFIAMLCDDRLPSHYVMRWIEQNKETIVGYANGTTFLEINKRNFRTIPIPIPPDGALEALTAELEPLHRRLVTTIRESKALQGVRDELLPKLVSGAIRVPEDYTTGGEPLEPRRERSVQRRLVCRAAGSRVADASRLGTPRRGADRTGRACG